MAQGLPGRSDSGADGSRPPTSAAIGGRDLGTRAATAEAQTGTIATCPGIGIAEPANTPLGRLAELAELANSCSREGRVLDGHERGPSCVRGLGPTTPGIRRDRTWPGQSRQACVTWTERAGGSGARAPARRRPCQAKAALCEGGVARIRGRGARGGLLVEDFLFHAAAAPISTRPPSSGSLGPTEGDARCPYVNGAAARFAC